VTRRILTIETSCDETAAAVISDRLEVLGATVATQHELHERFRGVVPEIASRAHVERIMPVIDECLRQAGIMLADIDAVAVANTPGLAGSLLVGLSAAKALCVALDVPLLAVNHLQAHIYACQVNSPENVFPCVGLIVSGGHTSLYRSDDPLDFTLLGATIDDAAGEAFDKVASMLGLGYPGSPAIEHAAHGGDRTAYRLPRAMLDASEGLDFSFSGLKTAVRYKIAPPGNVDFDQLSLTPKVVDDLAASFQEAVVDVLARKATRALRETKLSTLCVGGGVAANGALRERLVADANANGFTIHIAPPELCTDNAVMGAIAIERLRAGLTEPLDLDIIPGPARR